MSRSHTNRMLREYYDVMQKQGVEAADMLFDVYENTGLYQKGGARGVNNVDRLLDLKNSKPAQKTIGYIDDAAEGVLRAADSIPLGKGGAAASRFAGTAIGKNLAKAIPVLGAGMSVLDAGDIVFGQDSAANKVMDGTAMAIGGTIGGVLGMGNPLLAAAGASTGKFASDSLQWLFGDKKTAEQRKMEEALAALQGRYI